VFPVNQPNQDTKIQFVFSFKKQTNKNNNNKKTQTNKQTKTNKQKTTNKQT
jgi:hypothetical protein